MSASLHSDALLAATAGAGWACERVYRELSPAVLGYVRAQGVPDPEATVQEVFVKVFRRLRRFDGDEVQFRSWVFTIAHNQIVDERRFTARRPCVADSGPPSGATSGGDVEADAFARLGSARVEAVLATLSPDQRDVLLLRMLADLSLEDVASTTGRTIGAVKSLQKRGVDALRRRIAEIVPEAVSP